MPNLNTLENALPVAPLKLVVMDSAQKMGEEINSYLVEFRKNINNKFSKETGIQGYIEDSYFAKAECPRFGTGEGKGVFKESIRGKDLFILVDVSNHSLTDTVNGYTIH
ncbi:MAG: ribose-phosphate pyrophosphokinase-like domain-containing protein, partial [Lachnospiraceae bacterium]|nr:ribose-phosphate pyrophosphokinase-like domain-containing protein [Lachnospiraceae bacterium]